MPFGFERLNERRKQPNERIVFIKPLDGPDNTTAQDYLERIAAICNPIMKANHLYVLSLEEYEPNREFLGRNFNGGEVIQLVLKSLQTRQWLPFRFVQMVMMHELAHCKQMNHSKAFWKVRDGYAAELRELWAQNYTGEGLWSRGLRLESGQFADESLLPTSPIPEHLCGGTYRSSRKRSKKPKLSYREQKERRIAKKFGKNGVALGADDEVKVKLEKGKKPVGKPRVAGSARGRELRAAAALARFETKNEEVKVEDTDETESDDDTDDDDKIKTEPNDAFDIDGTRMVDKDGRGLVKICEDENDGEEARNELAELRDMDSEDKKSSNLHRGQSHELEASLQLETDLANEGSHTTQNAPSVNRSKEDPAMQDDPPQVIHVAERKSSEAREFVPCQICSMENTPASLTCVACAHVLRPEHVPNIWRCSSEACRGSKYVNAGDCGICGVCGSRRKS